MGLNVLCDCGTFYAPSLTACPFCGRFKRAENILGTSVSRWDEWLAKQDEPLPFDDSLDALYAGEYNEWTMFDFGGDSYTIEEVVDLDSTGNASIDSFLKGMRW